MEGGGGSSFIFINWLNLNIRMYESNLTWYGTNLREGKEQIHCECLISEKQSVMII